MRREDLRQFFEFLDAESIRVAAWIGGGGLALAVANLVFAGILSPDDFGRLSLFQALLFLGTGVAPLGLEQLAVRRELPRRWVTIALVTGIAIVSAAALAAIGVWGYDLRTDLSGLLGVACIAGGVARITSSFDRAVVALNSAQFVVQLPHLSFLLLGLVLLALKISRWEAAASALAIGFGLSAAFGLVFFWRNHANAPEWEKASLAEGGRRWLNSLSFLSITVSGLLLSQLERLVIPRTLTLADLATFSVVFTVAGSPFKLLQGGIGYALMPRLRVAEDKGERRRLIVEEARRAVLLCAAITAGMLALAGPAVDLLYGEKYAVGLPLVAAVTVSGTLRVMLGVTGATVGAIGSERQLMIYQGLGWVATVVALGTALLVSQWGLVAVVGAIALGWGLRSLFGYGVMTAA